MYSLYIICISLYGNVCLNFECVFEGFFFRFIFNVVVFPNFLVAIFDFR